MPAISNNAYRTTLNVNNYSFSNNFVKASHYNISNNYTVSLYAQSNSYNKSSLFVSANNYATFYYRFANSFNSIKYAVETVDPTIDSTIIFPALNQRLGYIIY